MPSSAPGQGWLKVAIARARTRCPGRQVAQRGQLGIDDEGDFEGKVPRDPAMARQLQHSPAYLAGAGGIVSEDKARGVC